MRGKYLHALDHVPTRELGALMKGEATLESFTLEGMEAKNKDAGTWLSQHSYFSSPNGNKNGRKKDGQRMSEELLQAQCEAAEQKLKDDWIHALKDSTVAVLDKHYGNTIPNWKKQKTKAEKINAVATEMSSASATWLRQQQNKTREKTKSRLKALESFRLLKHFYCQLIFRTPVNQ